MRARPANLEDLAAVGALLHASLARAPSSLSGRADLPEGDLEAGKDAVGSALAADDLTWVLETGDQIAGVAVARRRSLARASHVGDLTLLVHPIARGRGGGRLLLDAVVEAATRAQNLHKLAMRVACDDEVTQYVLTSATPTWTRERIEAGALGRGALAFDVEVWGLIVGHGPQPTVT
jgi:L-amino acid N-acyltransferase YncA